MQLTTEFVREHLDQIGVQGWDSRAGTVLLSCVREAIVVPVVRRSGLRGAAAAQAEASGWEAAWEALRRPSARGAENPAGMAYVAVRRAVGAERRAEVLSLDLALETGLEPEAPPLAAADHLGRNLELIVERLVEHGWVLADARDAVALLAHEAHRTGLGQPATRWRWVALRTGLPEWRIRRLACVLLGTDASPGLLALVARWGCRALDHPAASASLRSTSSRWAQGPAGHLARASAARAGVQGSVGDGQAPTTQGRAVTDHGYHFRIA